MSSFDEIDPPTRIQRAQDVLLVLTFVVLPFTVGAVMLAVIFGFYWAAR